VSRAVVLALLGLLSVVPALPAAAHSLLLASSPAAEATVSPPAEITLRFNNRIEKRLSRVRLVDPRGENRTLEVRTDATPADELHASAPALAPGRYRLEWRVLSTDGHVVSGGFSFRVAE
jgi:methionine-rich copper-binding protein CopC